jgi:uncharacterized membrane-anchored protein YhcB (DUF1043 family)
MNAETAAITMMWAEIAIACGVFAAGILVGLFVSRFGSGARGKAHKLEKELALEREASRQYHEHVAEHFTQTSDMFGELTHKYTALYTHLAEGARTLCADRAPTIGSAFENVGLLAASSDETGMPEPAQEPTRDAASAESVATGPEPAGDQIAEGDRVAAVAIDSAAQAERVEPNGRAQDEDEPRPSV